MFAVFGKVRAEEEKRRELVYDKLLSKWCYDRRNWKRLSNSRYQISPEYSSIDTAEEFIRLSSGNPDIHIVGIRQSQEVDGKTVWKPVKSIVKRKQKCRTK